MGDALNDVTVLAFQDELEKISGRFGALKALGSRIANPKEGLKAGWKALAPSNIMSSVGKQGKELRGAVGKTQAAQGKTGIGAAFQRNLGAGTHLSEQGGGSVKGMLQNKNVQGAAEELSRRGWTGQGKFTKYVPLGEKGQMALGAASVAPGAVRAAQGKQREGGPGVGQQIGEQAGWMLPTVLAGGIGGVGGMAAPLVGSMLAGRAGRALDRKRRGPVSDA